MKKKSTHLFSFERYISYGHTNLVLLITIVIFLLYERYISFANNKEFYPDVTYYCILPNEEVPVWWLKFPKSPKGAFTLHN